MKSIVLAALASVGLLCFNSALAFDTTPIRVGSADFRVEIARTEEERARGLMFRQELPQDQGMLFMQPPGPAAFWMKNTYIPLDLLYFDGEGRLVQIHAETPICSTPRCPLYLSASDTVRYILEINAGESAQRGIRLGDQLRFDSIP